MKYSLFKNIILIAVGFIIVLAAPLITTKDSFEHLDALGWILLVIGALRLLDNEK